MTPEEQLVSFINTINTDIDTYYPQVPKLPLPNSSPQ